MSRFIRKGYGKTRARSESSRITGQIQRLCKKLGLNCYGDGITGSWASAYLSVESWHIDTALEIRIANHARSAEHRASWQTPPDFDIHPGGHSYSDVKSVLSRMAALADEQSKACCGANPSCTGPTQAQFRP